MVLEQIGEITRAGKPLRLRDLPDPEPDQGEVRVRVRVCAVCHTELDQIEGRVATEVPRVLGHQVIGTIDRAGPDVNPDCLGQRVGVGWIGAACGQCKWCDRGEENLCPAFSATGCQIDGGYAEYMTVAAGFTHPVPEPLSDVDGAPMLCAGAIGLRSLRLSGIEDGQILGLTGFGASNHLVLTLTRILYPHSRVMVWARDSGQRDQARELGAHWAGDTQQAPPEAPDAIIDTTPVWTPVLSALTHLAPGGRLVINAIAKEGGDRVRLAELDYQRQVWREKEIKSVANVTRGDIRDYLRIAAEHDLTPEVQTLPLERANEAIRRIRFGDFRGAFVLEVESPIGSDHSLNRRNRFP